MLRARATVLTVAVMIAALTAGGAAPGDAAESSPPLTVEIFPGDCSYGQISPDSTHWVCLADDDATPGAELYAVPLDGSSPPTRLSPVLATTFDEVSWFELTPDGSSVVFAQGTDNSDSEAYFDRTLFVTPIDGSAVVEIAPWMRAGDIHFLWRPDLAPDGSRLAFWWYNETEGGLYTMNLDGSDLVYLEALGSVSFLPTAEEMASPVWDWTTFTPDPGWLYYYAGQGEVWTVPATGGTPTNVTGTNPVDGDVAKHWFTADSSRIVYLADHDTKGVVELYATPIGGGSTTKLNQNLAPGEYVVDPIALLPDSSGVIYGIGGSAGSDVPVWHVVGIDGGASTEVTDGLWPVHVTNDSSTMIVASPDVTAYPLDGAEPTHLGDQGTALLSPDSSVVWLWQDIGNFSDSQLYTVPPTGGDLTIHSRAILSSSTGFIDSYVRTVFSPDSQWLLYASYHPDSRSELWAVSRDGDGEGFVLADEVIIYPPETSKESGIHVAPDSARVVYGADHDGTGLRMYSTLLTRYPEAADATWQVDEDTPVGSTLGMIDAFDPDGDTLSFSTSGGTIDVDAVTGAVTLAQSLDYESDSGHEAVVAVDDGLVTTSVTVTIDVGNVNDNAPIASDLAVSVAEDAGVDTVLGQLSAVDADGDPVTFGSAESDALFGVSDDGVVTLAGMLDFETASSHTFTVEATDGVFIDTATVTVNVLDVYEEPITTTTTTTSTTTTTTTTTTTLPPDPDPAPEFGDVDDSNVFHDNIIWLATTGITRGCNPPVNDQFCPNEYVTRGQMAAFLHRALGDTLTTGDPINFTDDNNTTFKTDIEWLSATGITKGCNPPTNDQFCPGGYVTRGQMAAFLDRALHLPDPATPNLFTDDDQSPFETAIDRLATAGITRGCNPPDNTLYCPNQYVTRAQMAAFLHRALNN